MKNGRQNFPERWEVFKLLVLSEQQSKTQKMFNLKLINTEQSKAGNLWLLQDYYDYFYPSLVKAT